MRRTLVERYEPSAAQRTFDVFRMALRYAFNLDIIKSNPALAVARVKTKAPKTAPQMPMKYMPERRLKVVRETTTIMKSHRKDIPVNAP